jgi:hypothetical protein
MVFEKQALIMLHRSGKITDPNLVQGRNASLNLLESLYKGSKESNSSHIIDTGFHGTQNLKPRKESDKCFYEFPDERRFALPDTVPWYTANAWRHLNRKIYEKCFRKVDIEEPNGNMEATFEPCFKIGRLETIMQSPFELFAVLRKDSYREITDGRGENSKRFDSQRLGFYGPDVFTEAATRCMSEKPGVPVLFIGRREVKHKIKERKEYYKEKEESKENNPEKSSEEEKYQSEEEYNQDIKAVMETIEAGKLAVERGQVEEDIVVTTAPLKPDVMPFHYNQLKVFQELEKQNKGKILSKVKIIPDEPWVWEYMGIKKKGAGCVLTRVSNGLIELKSYWFQSYRYLHQLNQEQKEYLMKAAVTVKPQPAGDRSAPGARSNLKEEDDSYGFSPFLYTQDLYYISSNLYLCFGVLFFVKLPLHLLNLAWVGSTKALWRIVVIIQVFCQFTKISKRNSRS